MESKDIIVAILGIIGSILVYIILEYIIKLDFVYVTITFLSIFVLISTYYLHKRIKERDERLENIKTEQKEMKEKLNIYERLSKIEATINITKNGKK